MSKKYNGCRIKESQCFFLHKWLHSKDLEFLHFFRFLSNADTDDIDNDDDEGGDVDDAGDVNDDDDAGDINDDDDDVDVDKNLPTCLVV